jgi:dTDP-4-amino-4,6-dideoxygalactose transaminase
MFEEELSNYTGAPYVVSIDSCTNAIFLCAQYLKQEIYQIQQEELPTVIIPRRTYLSVPQSFIHAGYQVAFKDIKWSGLYKIEPTCIYDSAKLLTSDMYIPGSLMCVSFHIKKTLPIGRGGAILTNSLAIYNWLKRARYDGRGECNYKDDDITTLGWNFYLEPSLAARGLSLLMNYPKNVEAQEEENDYKDLTEYTVFKQYPKDII